MPFQPAANIVEVTVYMSKDSQTVLNILHVEFTTRPTQTDMEALLDDMAAFMETNAPAATASGVSITSLKAIDLTDELTAPVFLILNPVINGGAGSSSLPNNVSLAIKLGTRARGRGAQGRIYVPGLAREWVVGNTVSQSTISLLVGYYTGLVTAIDSVAGRLMVVLHRFRGGVRLPNAVGSDIATVSVTDAIVDSQRRRLPGRGI